jgi:hypothetical protein
MNMSRLQCSDATHKAIANWRVILCFNPLWVLVTLRSSKLLVRSAVISHIRLVLVVLLLADSLLLFGSVEIVSAHESVAVGALLQSACPGQQVKDAP